MKILSIAICRWNEDTEEPVVLHNNHEVSEFGFFQRSGCVSFLSVCPFPTYSLAFPQSPRISKRAPARGYAVGAGLLLPRHASPLRIHTQPTNAVSLLLPVRSSTLIHPISYMFTPTYRQPPHPLPTHRRKPRPPIPRSAILHSHGPG